MHLSEEFYTPAEVAKLLKVSKQTVWGWTRSGELRSLHVGRSVRVPRADLQRFLYKGTTGMDREKDDRQKAKPELKTAIARADAIRARIRARVGRPLPSSTDDLRALREERSRER